MRAPTGPVPVALTPAHLPAAAGLVADPDAAAWAPAQLTEELARADRFYLVVPGRGGETADGVVGIGGIALLADAAHVMTLVVDRDHRRGGVGTALLGALVERARAAGLPVTLEVRASNTAALRLYGLAGFVAAGRRPGYYRDGEDAVVLWRR